jgi:proline iminopeptidase
MTVDNAQRRNHYPEIEPYRSGTLRVSDLHEIYFEESGNPQGKPVLFVHGGPGGRTRPEQRRLFDPDAYRIVLFDQRGCGKSRPHASLTDNTTWHLIADMERIRQHLDIEQWQLLGGSWGSTLALAYAEEHPERVTELVLRGIFLLRRQEIIWFYQQGADAIFPDAWEEFLAPIPADEHGDLLHAYHSRLTSDDPAVQQAAAKAWSIWEGKTSSLRPNPDLIARSADDDFSLARSRIECHYFVNGAFFDHDGQLITNAGRIRHIPIVIIQGRYDVVCPMASAWTLHRALPGADFRIVPDAGHSETEPGILHELIEATDRFRAQ